MNRLYKVSFIILILFNNLLITKFQKICYKYIRVYVIIMMATKSGSGCSCPWEISLLSLIDSFSVSNLDKKVFEALVYI